MIDATGAIDGGCRQSVAIACTWIGTSGACASVSTTFVDGEVPSGTINGTNAAFTLANVPNPSSSLALFRNGLLLTQGGDYTLASNAVTFQTGARAAKPAMSLAASYRLAVSIPGVSFVDQQTPTRGHQWRERRFHAQPGAQPQHQPGGLSERPADDPRSGLHAQRRGDHVYGGFGAPIQRHT